MTFVVDAPLVLARDQAGRVHHCYQGALIPWLDDEQRKHFVGLGLVHEVGDMAAPDEPDSDDTDPDTGGRPTEDDSKADLVAWVLANAEKEDGSDYSESELNRLNKGQLVELINSVPDEPDSDDTGSEE